MDFLVSLFSSEAVGVSATGSWQVTAESREEATGMARFYANSIYCPPAPLGCAFPLRKARLSGKRGSGIRLEHALRFESGCPMNAVCAA